MLDWVRKRLSNRVVPPRVAWQTDEPVEPLAELSERESRLAAESLISEALQSSEPVLGLIRADAILKATVDSRVSTIVRDFHGEGQPPIMCRKGCGHCCRLSVSIFAFEAFAIADHVNRTWTPRERKGLLRRIDNYRKEAATLKPEDLYPKCPFLLDDCCSIHTVRPAICRTHNSTNLQHCLAHPRMRPPGSARFYDSVLPLLQGVKTALGGRAGHPSGLDMALAVGIALTNPTALEEFEAGGDPFKPAHKSRANRA